MDVLLYYDFKIYLRFQFQVETVPMLYEELFMSTYLNINVSAVDLFLFICLFVYLFVCFQIHIFNNCHSYFRHCILTHFGYFEFLNDVLDQMQFYLECKLNFFIEIYILMFTHLMMYRL